jgi:hypothetical protein
MESTMTTTARPTPESLANVAHPAGVVYVSEWTTRPYPIRVATYTARCGSLIAPMGRDQNPSRGVGQPCNQRRFSSIRGRLYTKRHSRTPSRPMPLRPPVK